MKTFKELSNLSGRVALITGGAGHLGIAFGETLAELGAMVALADINGKAADKAAKKLTETWNVPCVGIETDLSVQKEVKRLPELVASKLGSLDILINNAGFVGTDNLSGWCVPFEEQSADTWRKAIEVNMTAPFFLIQSALPWLKSGKCGAIINITSIYAFIGPDMRIYENTKMGNPAAYAASKGGLLQITRWLATVLAPDVRVNCLSPGGIYRNQPEAFVNSYEKRVPLKRMAHEDDLKGAIAFLASDLSTYMTGQHIIIDGGLSIW